MMRYFLLISLFFFCTNMCFALPVTDTNRGFDVKKANQQFDRINLKLSVQNLDYNTLDSAVTTLTLLSHKAELCIQNRQKKLNNIELLIKQDGGAQENKTEGADLVYLNNQQKILSDEQAQCRLFSIRANEAIDVFKNAIAKIKQEETFTRGHPLWNIIQQLNSPSLKLEPGNFSWINSLLSMSALISWTLVGCISLIVSSMILLKMPKNRFVCRNLKLKKASGLHLLCLSLFFMTGMMAAFFFITSSDFTISNPSLVLSSTLFGYLASLIILFLLFQGKQIRAFFYWDALDVTFFQSAAFAFLNVDMMWVIASLFKKLFSLSDPLWALYQAVFVLLVLATTQYYTTLFCSRHAHLPLIKNYGSIVQRLSASILFACGVITILGYYKLTQHLIFSAFTTFVIALITTLIMQGINKLYQMLSQQQTTKLKLIQYFGYRTDQVFTEFLILKYVTQILMLAISLYLVSQSWDFATSYIDLFYGQLLNGVHFANVTIYPTGILTGVVVFCVLHLIFRAIATSITRQQEFDEEEETQVAVASILSYVGFGLALISGSLVAGFDFTGLAIIAGALSVGIGLGLQSIVNNFVSGLILLIEKPIRPGDRINVDGIEGFVKKIRVRSTQVMTLSREDIIIPNSELITRPVTNYMYSDKFCRITCNVGVAYGSDTRLVKDVLLKIANGHDEVIKTGRNKPTVLFVSFADNTLDFQLSCLIKDVNKKGIVQSDLNFEIDDAFREHQIEMPFPQREVHIKLSELPSEKTIFENESA